MNHPTAPSSNHGARRLLIGAAVVLLVAGGALSLHRGVLAAPRHDHAIASQPHLDFVSSTAPLNPCSVDHRLRQIFRRVMRAGRCLPAKPRLIGRLSPGGASASASAFVAPVRRFLFLPLRI